MFSTHYSQKHSSSNKLRRHSLLLHTRRCFQSTFCPRSQGWLGSGQKWIHAYPGAKHGASILPRSLGALGQSKRGALHKQRTLQLAQHYSFKRHRFLKNLQANWGMCCRPQTEPFWFHFNWIQAPSANNKKKVKKKKRKSISKPI